MTQPYPPKPAPRAQHTPLYYKTRTVVRGTVYLAAASGIVAGYWLALGVAALWR